MLKGERLCSLGLEGQDLSLGFQLVELAGLSSLRSPLSGVARCAVESLICGTPVSTAAGYTLSRNKP